MTNNPDRLAEIQASIAKLDTDWQSRHNLLLDEMIVVNEQLDQLTRRVDQLTQGVNQLTQGVDRLAEGQEVMQSNMNQLTNVMIQFAQNAEADRAEIRQIWQYLLGQRPNGHQ